MPPTAAQLDRALASFDWAAWQQKLLTLYGPWYRQTLGEAGRESAASRDAVWRNDDPGLTEFATQYIGDRITQISETTRDRVKAEISKYFDDLKGEDAAEAPSLVGLGSQLANLFDEFSRSRAAMIARTETAFAVNHGQAFNYRQEGYQYVLIADGDDFDEPCAEADGQVWSISYFLGNAIEHPNCERSASPITDEDAEAAGIDEE